MADRPLTTRDWIGIFGKICEAIESAKGRLNELDGAIGDGDHGVTMSIGMRAVKEALDRVDDQATLDQVFKTAGQSFLTAAGGAIGPLIGSMWTDTAKLLTGRTEFGVSECKQMLQAMQAAVIRRGKAKLGDKTLLDALSPAVTAAMQIKEEDLAAILRAAADAAEAGAESTTNMISRLGRSSRLGNRTLGHHDAGAASLAVIFRTMSNAVQSA